MGAIFPYLWTEATRKITAVLIFGSNADVSTHLFLKNAAGFLMTISSTTLILNVILNVAVPASSAIACGCWRDESEGRKHYWCFLWLPAFPRGLPTQELPSGAQGPIGITEPAPCWHGRTLPNPNPALCWCMEVNLEIYPGVLVFLRSYFVFIKNRDLQMQLLALSPLSPWKCSPGFSSGAEILCAWHLRAGDLLL